MVHVQLGPASSAMPVPLPVPLSLPLPFSPEITRRRLGSGIRATEVLVVSCMMPMGPVAALSLRLAHSARTLSVIPNRSSIWNWRQVFSSRGVLVPQVGQLHISRLRRLVMRLVSRLRSAPVSHRQGNHHREAEDATPTAIHCATPHPCNR